jgi:Na+/H+ antiporter NhaD/arsenite permease-like protein
MPAVAGPLTLSWWSAAPFALMLLAIAVLPLIAGRFWHANRNKAIVAALLGVPVVIYLLTRGPDGAGVLIHEVSEYVSFIVLLGSLYVVAGSIAVQGSLSSGPAANTLLLAVGAVLANLVGTTGASMLLIRPYLRANRGRPRTPHLVVFFIFIVGNLGGLLTPLGDPPLFLGFIKKVDFFWTLRLWPQWLLVNSLVLTVFFCWEQLVRRREPPTPPGKSEPLRLTGWLNLLFLAGVVGGVVLTAYLPAPWDGFFIGEALMALMALLSLTLASSEGRRANDFSWGPIVEVAILFAGIFVTMAPALQLLNQNRAQLGIAQPWQYFWLTGLVSAVLDNAPTYVSFGTLAAGSPDDFSGLMEGAPLVLAAISCGAVFMGALTYLGNGPNFMIKAIADEMDVPAPSFFGYMAYSSLVLLPVFGLVTVVFFRG